MAGAEEWIRVPVGDDAGRWATRGHSRKVLFVVHNVTSATRLLDVLPLFHDDFRVQLLVTCTGSSAFRAGVAELLAETGVPVVPWDQAVQTSVDLAVSASFGGQLSAYSGKLVILSHGVGYTKKLARPGAPSQEPAPVFGLSPEWLLNEGGRPVADALVLSHPEQYERLRSVCPEAAPTAVLAGDPCWDRMLTARPYRERYRRALGVAHSQRLILLSSTWSPDSLFGDPLPSLLSHLTSELPVDDYRLTAVLHPNIWHGHGPGQVRNWLDRARRAGLTLVDPLRGWRQALLAADAVIGDQGAVTYYAAALGTPVLLGAAPLANLAPDAPVHDFVRTAPRVDPARPLRPQLAELIETHAPSPEPAAFTSSVPGESATRLRRLFYDIIGIPEPDAPPLLEPLPLPPFEPAAHTVPLEVLTRLLGATEVSVARYGGPHPAPDATGATHTATHEDTRDQSQLSLSDVVFRHGEADDPRFGSPARWTSEVLDRHPQCRLAAYITGPGTCTIRTSDDTLLYLRAESGADADPAAYASALHAWLAADKSLTEVIRHGLTVRTGGTAHHVRVTLN